MNPCKSKQEYLDQVIEPARRVCKRYGYLPSVLIAQACLENGYGMDSACNPLIQVNNMVGQKSELLNKSWTSIGLSVWPGKSALPTSFCSSLTLRIRALEALQSTEARFYPSGIRRRLYGLLEAVDTLLGRHIRPV